jgi:hypothetical protein
MNKGNKKINGNNTSNNNTNNKQLNSNYNVIINQNSTFNQDNSINIMLDGAFPYFQNYNYQSNEADLSNPKYSFYQDYQQIKTQENQTNSQKNNSNELSLISSFLLEFLFNFLIWESFILLFSIFD